MCPPILCIVLCHRKLDGGSIKSAVQFHVSGFNITEDDLQYNLVGTVHHRPSGPDHGHYTSICQSQQSQSCSWFNYNDHEVSFSNFTNKWNDKALKAHTKMATILFYVSGALQTRIRSRSAIVDLQDDTTSYSSPVNDKDGTGEGGGGEDDATSSSSSESVSNNRISQAFLQRVEGHYCSIFVSNTT